MQKQLDELHQKRENDQAQILIFEQMLADFKQQESDQVKELEEQIDDLKAKLDKTEYIIQYKEKIWTYLEREIRKVVHEDSDLMQKVKAQTKILTDCLATTKVSNVVKQNDNLLNDHTMGCDMLQRINKALKHDLIQTEIIVQPTDSAATQQKLAHLNAMKGSLKADNSDFPDGQRLSTLVKELQFLVDA